MPALKSYTPPQIFEVPLRQEQAMLVTCTVTYTSATGTMNNNKCGSTATGAGGTGCKFNSTNPAQSNAAPLS